MDMQQKIAARRAELERERATAEAERKTAAEAHEVERRAAAEAAWAEQARARKAEIDRAEAPADEKSTIPHAADQPAAASAGEFGDIFEGLFDARRKRTDAAGRAASAEASERMHGTPPEAGMEADASGPTDKAKVAAPVNSQAELEKMLREAIKRRWTKGERGWIGGLTTLGLLLMLVHPIGGLIVLLLGIAMFAGARINHRDAIIKQYPDLFGSLAKKP